MKKPESRIIDVEPEVAALPDPRAWRSMDCAPRDNTLIEAKARASDGDDTAFPIKYRVTRRRDHARRCWAVVGFWANAITREELTVEPEVWRLPEGFLVPGMVV